MMEKPIKMDDLGVSLFLETPKYPWHLVFLVLLQVIFWLSFG